MKKYQWTAIDKKERANVHVRMEEGITARAILSSPAVTELLPSLRMVIGDKVT